MRAVINFTSYAEASRRAARHRAIARLILATMGIMMILIGAALAHDLYPARCCSGQDCEPIDARHVKESADGFEVTLGPDDHKMMKHVGETRTWFIPRKSVELPLDFNFHICLSKEGKMLCFYPRDAGALLALPQPFTLIARVYFPSPDPPLPRDGRNRMASVLFG